MAYALSRLRTDANHLYHSTTDTASEGIEIDSDGTITASEGRDDDELSSGATAHSAERDASDLIPHVESCSSKYFISLHSTWLLLQAVYKSISTKHP